MANKRSTELEVQSIRSKPRRKNSIDTSAAVTQSQTASPVSSAEAPKIAPLPIVVRRLIFEAVASRMRHRALLEIIESGAVSKERYFESYKAIYDRDNEALSALLLLEQADFDALFHEWREDDIKRYGVPDRVEALRKPSHTKKSQKKL